ncbi:MAG: PRC-barrel domain-containing protein [Hyphomicrobiales bacterium]|nr:PRC-barrel domain-containing protein [Hyphomicrobiales bacterium]
MRKSIMRESIIFISAISLMAAGISVIVVGTRLALPEGQGSEDQIVIPKSLQPLPRQHAATGDLGQAEGTGGQPVYPSTLVGLRVYSTDGREVGDVVKVSTAANGEIRHLYVEIPEFLGLGTKTVRIPARMYEKNEDGVELVLTADAVNMLPEANLGRTTQPFPDREPHY